MNGDLSKSAYRVLLQNYLDKAVYVDNHLPTATLQQKVGQERITIEKIKVDEIIGKRLG